MVARKFTDGTLEAALRKHAGIKSFAAKELGVERSTIQSRVDRSRHLQAVISEIEETVLDMSEGVIIEAVRKGDRQTARWYAERRGRARGYGNKVETPPVDEEQLARFVAAFGGDVVKLGALRNALTNGTQTPEVFED